MKTIQLKKKETLRPGNYWIFSNQIQTSLKQFSPGAIVDITDDAHRFIGRGYVNPHSLIAVRLLTREAENIDETWIRTRIQRARIRRQRLIQQTNCYRLIYGESDGLPGLVVDCYAEDMVVQSLTAGMDVLLPTVLKVLQEEFSPKTLILRNDSAFRNHENIEIYRKVFSGMYSGITPVEIYGIHYELDLLNGQKTGFFLDQRENQLTVRSYAEGKKTLDCFSYVGAWALNAANGGATEVTGWDISDKAIDLCRRHVSINGLHQCRFEKQDVFDALKIINDRKERFDLIILDPPAFVKSRSEVNDALRGYREINRRAAKALNKEGVLITCSCSHLVDRELFRTTVLQGISAAGREAFLLEQRTQAADHPILLSMRETEYLKCLILQIF